MLKNKLYQYFLKEIIKNFFIIILSLSLLMLLTQAAKFLTIITEMGNSIDVYIKFVLLNYPRTIEKTIPISFMLCIFFTISKLKGEKELNVFWYSGVSQKRIFKIILIAGLLIFILNYFLSIFFSPYSLSLARNIMSKSEFTLVNSLVKEKNFNSPLKKLTIYVDKNNMKGNLEKIFIFEPDRTISAKKANVFKEKNSIYLELYDGISQERNNLKINTIKFDKLIFNFSKFTNKNLKVEKFSERNIFAVYNDLTKNKKNTIKDKINLRYEINKRLIKPFFIFFICIVSSYVIYIDNNKRKFNANFLIFTISFLSLIVNEILLGFSSKNFFFSILYIFIIFISCLVMSIKHFKK